MRCGFTLSEVLITLGIIGVIAALTIPSLLNNIQDAQLKTGYKKAFSDASRIWLQMVTNNEITERTNGGYDGVASLNNFNVFKTYFKVIKECGFDGGSNAGCWDFTGDQIKPAGTISVPYARSGTSYAVFIDAQGRQWMKNNAGETFGEIIYVDTNGSKPPNSFGKDRFPFYPVLSTCPKPNVAGSTCKGDGISAYIKAYPTDETNISSPDMCNTVNCYYRSWLLE